MKKSLPLIAGAVIIPLFAATVAAFAAASEVPSKPLQGELTTTTSAPASTTSASTPEAPAESDASTSTTPPAAPPVATSTTGNGAVSSTTAQTPTTPIAPNEWQTPEPTTQPLSSPIATGGPIDMTVSWDGLKCARSDAWSVDTPAGTRWMCPGSQNP